MPTSKDQPAGDLAADNARLQDENADLRAQLEAAQTPAAPEGTAANTAAPRPARPDFGLSAGEASDLAVHGVTVSPFTGETLTASGEGVTPETPTARANDKRETARLRAARPAESVPAGPPPATGGDTTGRA